MGSVLIVEDQATVARALALALDLEGIPCLIANGPVAALALVERGAVDAVIQDMNFSPGETSGREGVELFREIRRRDPDMPVLLVTAWASLETAVRLMQEGAADYLEKPWDDERLVTGVRRALARRAGRGSDQRLDEADQVERCGVVCVSPAMRAVVELALKVARADVPVLITGPNGTGKERVADLVHAASRRCERAFVKVNAGALPDTLLEAELFGAEPGAYTGSETRRVGRFETADGGSLLLDEIGTLSLTGQTKLLRVLQTGEFERLGSSRTQKVDVRVLAATNSDLERAIAEGRFREDLLFRLNVIELRVPALADRREDILPLAELFLAELAPAHAGSARRLSEAGRRALLAYDWPGNVRELRNRIQRAILVAAGSVIDPVDLGLGPDEPRAAGIALETDERTERDRLVAALERAGGVVAHAAEELGISRQALYRRMARLGLELERRPKR